MILGEKFQIETSQKTTLFEKHFKSSKINDGLGIQCFGLKTIRKIENHLLSKICGLEFIMIEYV